MRRNSIIISCMALVFIVVFLLIVDLHRTSEEEVLSQFQEHQLSHARYLAGQIKSYFESRLPGLQALSSFPSLQNVEPMERRIDLEAYLRQMKKVHVKAIFVLEERGIIVDSTDPKSQGLDFGSRDFFIWAKKKENQGKVFVSSSFPNSPPYHFEVLLVTPIYQDASNVKHSKRSRKFVGALLLLIDFEEFLSRQLTFIDPNPSLHEVWIIDKEGTLLYQSKHKDVVLQNIYRRDNNCTQCHTSFDYVEKILKERQGKVDYEMKNSTSKLAAFAPIDFENVPWIVVVNSAYNEVMAFERKSLRGHLMLLGIIVSVLIAGFILLNRNYQQKLKAEEEARHWREKRVLEDKIQQSEVRYRTIVENAHDAIWTVDSQGNFTFINRSGEEISGYKVSELVGKSFVPPIHPEDLPKMKDLFFDALQGRSQNFEVRFYAKDEEIHVLSVNAVPLYENSSVIGLFNIGRDITEHKKAEKALQESEKQLRYLSSQLLTAQETERRRISKELHDELGQALTVMKFRLGFAEKQLTKDQAKVREECEAISQYIDQVIENVRRLSRDLTPSILENVGLSAAIRWLIGNFNKNDDINITLDIMDIDHLFSENAQIIIYRVIQEALTNIGKHAQAKNVSVVIKKHGDRVSFSVEDDGIGFDMSKIASVNPAERGLGLAIMDERVRMLEGSLEMWSQEGKGTRISFHIPLKKEGNL